MCQFIASSYIFLLLLFPQAFPLLRLLSPASYPAKVSRFSGEFHE